ncbi:aldehyde dehydrogenase [Arthrobacter sp. MYb224]|uniref:aldehyde dehydrogenase family protein n=1 Tax=Micrococcaceae TaxID=1268 RepID=UPI000CFD6FCC|nr:MULTISPECIES: aldehyde dehydrogenase family protein [unclassified Arthrobacter]PQZ97561.1 aldehyde dehydrogenase [Arthrobacter sp. MYb224]PRA04208.1 aldehyde dehydrogenase [Arthrobacter sp. MYb229]PRB51880.1 aldehyde dehydrogenase [Arthrobacter sp. MYb216]
MTYGLLKNLVNGEFVASDSGAQIDVYNPATAGEKVGSVPAMSSDEVARVFAAAEAGAKTWKKTNQLQRGRVLLNAAALIRERSDELASLIVTEMGKTKAEATGEVGKTAEFFEYYGGMGRDSYGDFLADARPGTFAARIVEPLGVVLLITPWNDPFLTPARKLGPALISGNAVVIKPATVTPLITLRLAEILHEAGLPAGVLGTVTGRGSELGDALFDYAGLRAVSFTGSTAVGKGIQAKLAGGGIRVQTEMGGKNAAVVLDDADLDLAIPTIVAGAFAQAGQRCTATSRLIVQKGIALDVRTRIADAVAKLRVAAGSGEQVDLGPVVDEGAQSTIRGHVERAITQGAEVIARRELEGEAATAGAFVEPTFLGITTEHDIWKEEVFGPVLGMVEVDSLDEAIAAVNDSAYGLSSAIFTRDLANAFRFLEEADTGQISINQPTTGWDIHHSFGGFKDSGSGYKEQGRDALAFYTRIKAAAIRTH